MNLKPDEVPACAAAYLRISLKAIEHGLELGPGTIETVLCEDNQSVVLTCELPDGETLFDGFKLNEATTEDEFHS